MPQTLTPPTALAPPARSAPPAPSAPPVEAPRAWSMELADNPEALVRVLSLLRRRSCRVLSVRYERGDRHRPATRLFVRAQPTGGRPDAVDHWLAGLADVFDVRRES